MARSKITYFVIAPALGLTLLSACSTAPSKPATSVIATAAATSAQRTCFQPTCCDDKTALQFEPHRLNCESIEQRDAGKSAQAWVTLNAAIAAANAAVKADSRKNDANEVLCFALNDAADRADTSGNDAQSQTLFQGNYEACKARFGELDDFSMQALYGGASQHIQRGRIELAKPMMERVRTQSKINEKPGLESFAIDALGRIEDMQGNPSLARTLLLQSIAIKKNVFGDRASDVAVSYTNLGASYIITQDGKTGREWYRQAIGIYSETLGEANPATLSVQTALAASHLADSELTQAERLYESLVPKSTLVYGATGERTAALINDWGATLARQDRHAEAFTKFDEAARIRRTTQPNSLWFGYSLLNAAKMKKITVDCAAAQPLRTETKTVLARLPAAVSQGAEGLEFAKDIADFETECTPAEQAAKRAKACAEARKKLTDLEANNAKLSAAQRRIKANATLIEQTAQVRAELLIQCPP